MKRLFDIFVAILGLILAAPILIPVCIIVWWQDFHSPFYVAPRMGRGEKPFRMIKLRSMIVNADKSKVDSTSANDMRITRVGHFIRKFKLDELTQLWNVLIGDMSLVGPRPNVKRETDLYTPLEKKLLTVRPGITDLASIVFADEGDILRDKADPDLAYNQLIRPWKSRLAMITVENQSFSLDLKIVVLTALTIVNRSSALAAVEKIVGQYSQDPQLPIVASRQIDLVPTAPLGANDIVMSREAVNGV